MGGVLMDTLPEVAEKLEALDDEGLIEAYVRARDERILAELIRRHAPGAFRIARRFGLAEADAEDAVQTAFIQVINHLSGHRPGASVRAWIMSHVVNVSRNVLRANVRRNAHEARAQRGTLAEAEPEADRRETLENVRRAVQELPEHYRMPLWLHYVEGLSSKEVAAALELQDSTVRNQLARGLEQLRAACANMGVAAIAVPGLLAALPLEPLPASLAAALAGLKPGAVAAGTILAAKSVAGAGKVAVGAGKATTGSLLAGSAGKVVACVVIATAATAGAVTVVNHKSSEAPAIAVKAPPIETAEGEKTPAGKGNDQAPLGSVEYYPSMQRPVGWRGDGTGRFPGATPPTKWSRRVKGITAEMRYQAAKPAGAPDKDSQSLEYFTIKDWLIAGPFSVNDPVQDFNQDHIGGEATAAPNTGDKAGATTWKFLRADVDTQSRHEHNGGTVGNLNIDFVYAFGNISNDRKLTVDETQATNKVAYAHTYLFAPKADKVRLRIAVKGAACRFWLNGKPTDIDMKNRNKFFDVDLTQGWNSLMVKVSVEKGVGKEYTGRWLSDWLLAVYAEPLPPHAYETQNITWMTKMTGRSMSQPIVVGDRIFVGSNISDLLCISKKDGRILWLKSTTPLDGIGAEDRENPAIKEKIEPLIAQLQKQTDEAVAAINAAVTPPGLSSDKTDAIDKLLKARAENERTIEKAFAAIDNKKYAPYYGNEVTSSSATPVSDGERVYWACGGGMKGPGSYGIVCFDLDGKRLWTRHEPLGAEEHGNHQSPLLVDGKLIYAVHRVVLAMDPKTGATIWKAENIPFNSGNSPAVAKINGESVLVTSQKILRVSDGSVICTFNLNIWGDPTPVVENGMICNPSRFRTWTEPMSLNVVKLPTSTAPGSKPEVWWDPPGAEVSAPIRGLTYTIASPLVLNNIMYGVDMTGAITAVDIQAKKSLYRHWLDSYNCYNRYLYGICASPALGGKTIYVIDDAGYTHLIEPGPEFKELGKNVLENVFAASHSNLPCHQEAFYTAPYFEGNAMYLRGEDYLYCIQQK